MRWLWLAVLMSACNEPAFRDCAVACTAVTGCPDGLSCGREGYCRIDEAAGSCGSLLPDGAIPDGATPDARPDAAPALGRITVSRLGSPNGRITSTPSGIDCPGTCSHDFARGTTVTLAAIPTAGATFATWDGGCTGTNPSCTFDVLGDRSAAAYFDCTGSRSFTYTGASETLTIPACATSATFDVRGAGGARANASSGAVGVGGAGGRVQARLALVAGDTFTVRVGGAGSSTTAGYNGAGGAGMTTSQAGGGGGGASDVRRNGTSLSSRVLVAGGGGGAGACAGNGYDGAPGGGLSGGNPAGCLSPTQIATGGTQTAGGVGGAYPEYCSSSSGSLGLGSSGCSTAAGGGGGGGYYGGGGGAFHGGGGGSSFAVSSATSVVHTQGYQTGNGVVFVTW